MYRQPDFFKDEVPVTARQDCPEIKSEDDTEFGVITCQAEVLWESEDELTDDQLENMKKEDSKDNITVKGSTNSRFFDDPSPERRLAILTYAGAK